MSLQLNLVSQKFCRLKVIAADGSKSGRSMWRCLCDCGAEVRVVGKSLTSGNTKSCGCLQREAQHSNGKSNLKHGHAKSGDKASSRTYNTWFCMKSRCEREADRMFQMYGGAGVRVCERWNIFENFLADMGERPAGKTLDRIEGSKGYYKENCRWATPKEQGQNNKRTRWFPYEGRMLTISDVSEQWGIPRERVKYYLTEKGLSVAELVAKEFK